MISCQIRVSEEQRKLAIYLEYDSIAITILRERVIDFSSRESIIPSDFEIIRGEMEDDSYSLESREK